MGKHARGIVTCKVCGSEITYVTRGLCKSCYNAKYYSKHHIKEDDNMKMGETEMDARLKRIDEQIIEVNCKISEINNKIGEILKKQVSKQEIKEYITEIKQEVKEEVVNTQAKAEPVKTPLVKPIEELKPKRLGDDMVYIQEPEAKKQPTFENGDVRDFDVRDALTNTEMEDLDKTRIDELFTPLAEEDDENDKLPDRL